MKLSFYFLFLVYFGTRLFNLSSLPIFNDESIYLHWGQIMVNFPNQAFFSLFDGKPPFILWLFGLFQRLPIDPLISGRLVSAIFGFLTLLGILKICQLLKFSQRGQIIAGMLYIFSPLTLFFDRLAILDSPVSTIFIWVLYFSLKISQSKTLNIKYPIILGLVQTVGIWIKGTARFFLFLPFVIPVLTIFIDKQSLLLRNKQSLLLRNKNKKKAGREVVSFFISFVLAQILFLPIRLQPLFPIFQKRESDFLLPLSQIFNPSVWSSHLLLLLFTLTFLVTPFVIIFCFWGFHRFFLQDKKSALILLLFSAIPLAVEIFFARPFLFRYFFFTILPIFIFAAYGLEQIKKWKKIAAIFTFILPVTLTLSFVLSSFSTLKTLSQNKILAQDLEQYFIGWTSGYGVKEAAEFLAQESQKGPIIVLLRNDSGNPEDGMFVYLQRNKNIIFAQATQKPKPEELKALSKFPIFFVSRGTQLLEMEDWLVEKSIFKKPLGEEFVGVYKVSLK